MIKSGFSNVELEKLIQLVQMEAISSQYLFTKQGISSMEETLARELEKDTLSYCIGKGTSSPALRKGNSYKKAYKTVQENPELLATYLMMPSETPPEDDQWVMYFAAKDLFESIQEVPCAFP
jgi:hypothetical protein